MPHRPWVVVAGVSEGLNPGQAVDAAIADLGRAALFTPGSAQKLAAFVMRRLLPRATATMGRAEKGFGAP